MIIENGQKQVSSFTHKSICSLKHSPCMYFKSIISQLIWLHRQNCVTDGVVTFLIIDDEFERLKQMSLKIQPFVPFILIIIHWHEQPLWTIFSVRDQFQIIDLPRDLPVLKTFKLNYFGELQKFQITQNKSNKSLKSANVNCRKWFFISDCKLLFINFSSDNKNTFNNSTQKHWGLNDKATALITKRFCYSTPHFFLRTDKIAENKLMSKVRFLLGLF